MKEIIENREGKKISLILEKSSSQKGLSFIMHGLGGFKEQEHVGTFAQAFLDADYTVIKFDARNTFGESEGNYEEATVTNYYEDLEDVIRWAKTQEWYQEPFVLVGHSLGGISTALYAENYPQEIKALTPLSTVISGKMSMETKDPEKMKKWKETGWKEKPSASKPGIIKRLPWSHMEDRLKYDLLENVEKLTMPVLLIVGENDDSTPVKTQEILFESLPGEKEIHIIKGAPHTFRDKEHLKEIKDIFDKWIEKI